MKIIKNYNVEYNPDKKIQCKNNFLNKSSDKVEKETNLKPEKNNSNLVLEMQKEKEKLLKKANQKANQIVQKAKNEASEIQEQAYAKGHDKGYMQGYEEGFEKGYNEKHQELEDQIKSLEETKTKYNELYNEYLFHAEQDILEIVMETTKKLTKDTFNKNPGLVKELIVNSIKSCSKKEKLVIRINPKHFEYIEKNKTKIIDSIKGLTSLKIFKDEDAKENECFIETPYGNISSSLESQIKNIEEKLKNMIKRHNYSSVNDYE